ncbi:MAG: hypothetical protein AAF558_13800, partial [Verrucomicrobiota bacterium]
QIDEAWYGLMLPLYTAEIPNKPMLLISLKDDLEGEDKAGLFDKVQKFLQMRLNKESIEILERPKPLGVETPTETDVVAEEAP